MREEAALDLTLMAMEGAQNEDSKLSVRFYLAPLENPQKSLEAGRPIFEDKEMVRIQVPGDKTNVIDREASDFDKHRFALNYARFKAGNTEQIIGTPLAAWPMMSRALVEELKYFDIRTVEQLANLRDDLCQKIPMGTSLKQKAEAFLLAAKEAAPVQMLTAQLQERDNKIAAQQAQIDALAARLDAAIPKTAPAK